MRLGASSFVEEVARRTWSDVKRRSSGENAVHEESRTETAVERENVKILRHLTPAEAAIELRKRLQERTEKSNWRYVKDGQALKDPSSRPENGHKRNEEMKSAILEAAERKWAEISGRSRRGQPQPRQGPDAASSGLAGERPGFAAPGTDLAGRAAFPALPARATRGDGAEDVRVTVTAEVAGGHSSGGAWLPGGRWSAPSRLDEVILGLAPGDLPPSPPRRSQRSQRAWEPLAEAAGPAVASAAAPGGAAAMWAAGGSGSLPAAPAPATGRFSAAPPAWGEHVNLNGINGNGGHGDAGGTGWLSDGREKGDESGGEPLPARVVELLVRVCGTQGQAAQEAATDELRELVHDSGMADSLSRERWALEALARPLLDGGERARVGACACFRHLALGAAGAAEMGRSGLVLLGLVAAMRDGSDVARQKAAAALGNLAWRSEANRRAVCEVEGALGELIALLREGSGRCQESALAALSNLTLYGPGAAGVAGRPGAVEALVGVLLRGTPKAQLRAAGILRNLAIEEGCRGVLRRCAGLVPALELAAARSAGEETRQRARLALQLLAGRPDDGSESDSPPRHDGPSPPPTNGERGDASDGGGGGAREPARRASPERNGAPPPRSAWEATGRVRSPGGGSAGESIGGTGGSQAEAEAAEAAAEAEAVRRLHEWLGRSGWEAVQERLFDLGETRYGRYARIEPAMVALDEARGLYLWRGRTLQLVGPDRYNPLLLVDTASREVVWDWESETAFAHPWARRHFAFRAEGGAAQVLLRRTGEVVARSVPAPSRPPSPPRGRAGGGGTRERSPSPPTSTPPESAPARESLPWRFAEASLAAAGRGADVGLRGGGGGGGGSRAGSPAPAGTASPVAPAKVPRPEPPWLSQAGGMRSPPADGAAAAAAAVAAAAAAGSPPREADGGAGLEVVLEADLDALSGPTRGRMFRATLACDLATAVGAGPHRFAVTCVQAAGPAGARPGGVEAAVAVLPPAPGDADRRPAHALVTEAMEQAARPDSALLAGQVTGHLLLLRPAPRGVQPPPAAVRQTLPGTQTLGAPVGGGPSPAVPASGDAYLQGRHLGDAAATSTATARAGGEGDTGGGGVQGGQGLSGRTSPGPAPLLSSGRRPEARASDAAAVTMEAAAADAAAASTPAPTGAGPGPAPVQPAANSAKAAHTQAVRLTLGLDVSGTRSSLAQFRAELQRDVEAAAGLEPGRVAVVGAIAAAAAGLGSVEVVVEGDGAGGAGEVVRALQAQCADPESALRRGVHTRRVTALVPIASTSAVAPAGGGGRGTGSGAAEPDGGGARQEATALGHGLGGRAHEGDGVRRSQAKIDRLGGLGGRTRSADALSGGGGGAREEGLDERWPSPPPPARASPQVPALAATSAAPPLKPLTAARAAAEAPPPTTGPAAAARIATAPRDGMATRGDAGGVSGSNSNKSNSSSGVGSSGGISDGDGDGREGGGGGKGGIREAVSAHTPSVGTPYVNASRYPSPQTTGIGGGATASGPPPSDPELWRALMTEGERLDGDGDGVGVIALGRRRLRGPVYDEEGLATVVDTGTGALFYRGPGRHEVFPPGADAVAALSAAGFGQLVEWCDAHGWHDLQRRLLDAGRTDFGPYTRYEQEMRAAAGGADNDGAGSSGLFEWRGRNLRLVGPSRWEPQRLLDEGTGEVLWDRQASTVPLHPWARDTLALERRTPGGRAEPRVRIADRKSGRVLLELEHAAFRDAPERRRGVTAGGDGAGSAGIRAGVAATGPHPVGRGGAVEAGRTPPPAAPSGGPPPSYSPPGPPAADPPPGPPRGQGGSRPPAPAGAGGGSAAAAAAAAAEARSPGPARGGGSGGGSGSSSGGGGSGSGSGSGSGGIGPTRPVAPRGAATAGSAAIPVITTTAASVPAPSIDAAASGGGGRLATDTGPVGLREAVERLREWTEGRGWYELRKRLLDAGETDYAAYAAVEPAMRPLEGRAGPGGEALYACEGRTLALAGAKMDPRALRDVGTGEVLWDFERATTFTYPWARAHFVLRPAAAAGGGARGGAGRFQIVHRGTGAVVVEYGAPSGGELAVPEASPLLLQAILMEAAPLVEGLGLQALVAEGLEVAQAIKEYDPPPAAAGGSSGGGPGQGGAGGRGSAQLRLRRGDLLQVRQHGRQGWNFGRVWLPDGGGGSSDGGDAREGWYPSTYAAPVQELATWRGRLVRITSREEAGQAHVVVGDTASGAVVFRGPAEAPAVVWASPWDLPTGSESATGARTGAGVTWMSPPTSGAGGRLRGSSPPIAAWATAAARAAWPSNRAAFEAGVSRRFSGEFRCATAAAGAPVEMLELRTDGRFVWVSSGGGGGGSSAAERLRLEGRYRTVPGSDPAVLLFRVEPAADGGGPAGEDGVCLRARLLAAGAGGRPSAVEWVSGHGGLGPGVAGRPLAATAGGGGQ